MVVVVFGIGGVVVDDGGVIVAVFVGGINEWKG